MVDLDFGQLSDDAQVCCRNTTSETGTYRLTQGWGLRLGRSDRFKLIKKLREEALSGKERRMAEKVH